MDLFGGLSLGGVVDSFKTKTTSSMQNVRDNTLTPIDVTTTNLNKGVAKKTARDTSVTSVVSDYRSDAVDSLDGIIGALSGGLLNTKDITKAIRVGKDGVTFDQDSLLGSASGELGFKVTSQSGAMRKLASTINSEFAALTGIQGAGIIGSDGKMIRVNKNWRTTLGSQTIKTVGAMSGLGQYFDSSVKSAVYNAVLKSAVEYGMSDSYANLYKNYPATLAAARRSAMLTVIDTAITAGDVKSLHALIVLLEANDRTVILSKYPKFIETLFSKFKFDDDVYPTDYPALLAMLLEVLTMVAGTNWWLKSTNFGDVLNLTIIRKASKDMITLLRGFDAVIPLLCCAGLFGSSSATVVLRSEFPTAPQFDPVSKVASKSGSSISLL